MPRSLIINTQTDTCVQESLLVWCCADNRSEEENPNQIIGLHGHNLTCTAAMMCSLSQSTTWVVVPRVLLGVHSHTTLFRFAGLNGRKLKHYQGTYLAKAGKVAVRLDSTVGGKWTTPTGVRLANEEVN